MKIVTQPQVFQPELNRIERYNKALKKSGYQPWVTVRQSHTHGQGHEIQSHKTGRTHNLLSRGERPLFFYTERNPNVIDIFDQYPLPIGATMALAQEFNIKHPGAYKERVNFDGIVPAKTMTTDIVALMKKPDGSQYLVAYNFKYQKSLDPKQTSPSSVTRTLKKMALEQAYWASQGVDCISVTEQSFDQNVVFNLEYLRECYDAPDLLDVSDEFYQLAISQFQKHFSISPEVTVRTVLERVSSSLNISIQQSQALFQKAVYEYHLKIDLSEPIELFRPLTQFTQETRYAS